MQTVRSLIVILLCSSTLFVQAQQIEYATRFDNKNHPEIGYWFISPDLIPNDKYLHDLDDIADNSLYTMLFLTAREGADFYDYATFHPVFKKLVEEAHKKGLKIGLQVWGNYKNVSLENSDRMIVDDEVILDSEGNASFISKARYIRFPDRLIKTDLLRAYAFKKTGEGFYDPATLKDITSQCKTELPDKETVSIKINGGKSLKGFTVCLMTQEYCTQSSNFGRDEINKFTEAINAYADIPFDGFALDEYGNKFVARQPELGPGIPFRGQWYSLAFAKEYKHIYGKPLEKALFDTRYAPQNKPESRMKAINNYMDLMRTGAIRVERAVYKRSKAVFGQDIFNGIHDTYHNSLINDEIWANGITWWNSPREYGQTDERTPTPVQMGVAMTHRMNAMYNQYYNINFDTVIVKALHDLRYGIRTHYHALNDKRPNRSDLQDPVAVAGINKVENCARLLNTFNPRLPEIKLLVLFGMEALENWYPDEAVRGIYDINDKMDIEKTAVDIWHAGYLNALMPSDVIVNKSLQIGKDGRPVINGHSFDAVIYLYPQFAKEPELKFLEEYESRGGKLMIVGNADHDFNANKISKRIKAIYKKATVNGFSIANIPKLGITKNLLPDGCKNEDGSYVFTDFHSLNTDSIASFTVTIDGDTYSGHYKGLAIIDAGKKKGVKKLAAAGFLDLSRNNQVILSFKKPVDIFVIKQNGQWEMKIADSTHTVTPLINKLALP